MMLLGPSPMLPSSALGEIHDVCLAGPWWTALYTLRWLYGRGES